VKIPVMAIGGINHTNIEAVARTGVASIAVVSAVCASENPTQAACDLSQTISAVRSLAHN
jgi:thiamine-phosphate pyrophosphorylase